MQLEQALKVIADHTAELRRRGVGSLSIFGSVARGMARPDSDIDILVEFSQPVGLFEFVRLQRYLAQILGRRVDLVTPDALREPMRETILREAVHAA